MNMARQSQKTPPEYDVEVVYDIASEIEQDPTRVQPWDELVEMVIAARPEPTDLGEYVGRARLGWILDDLGLGCFAAEILRRLENDK